MDETKKCMTDGCEGKHHARGVCEKCYTRLKKQVRRGRTTWGDLINEGLCKRVQTKCYGLTTAQRRENAKSNRPSRYKFKCGHIQGYDDIEGFTWLMETAVESGRRTREQADTEIELFKKREHPLYPWEQMNSIHDL